MLKLIALVALFAGFCWFGTQIPLGSHTLFGHLHAISETKESQDLFDGTKQSARPLVDDVRRRIAGVPAPAPVKDAEPKATPGAGAGSGQDVRAAADRRPDGGPAQETLTASERRRLRRLISSAESASARR